MVIFQFIWRSNAIIIALNAGRTQDAANEFLLYSNDMIKDRRRDEYNLFLYGWYDWENHR
jgi:hypothetical protein